MSVFPPLPDKTVRAVRFVASLVLLAALVYVGIFASIRQQQSQAEEKLALSQDALRSIIHGAAGGSATGTDTSGTPSLPVVELTYANAKYGFHFSYPSDWTVHELTEEIVYLNHTGDSNGADKSAFVFLYDIGTPFASTVTAAAKEGCMADGPTERLRCTDLVSQQAARSAQGLDGSVFVYQEDLQKLSGTEWTTSSTVNRTFFAFDLPQLKAKGPTTAIVVTAGRNVASTSLVAEIGNSLSFK